MSLRRASPLDARTRLADENRTRGIVKNIVGVRLPARSMFWNGRISSSVGQSIPNNSETKLTFDTTDKDAGADDCGGHADGSMADLTNNRLYARYPGWYRATLVVPWDQNATAAGRQGRIKFNDTTFIARGNTVQMGGGAFDPNPVAIAICEGYEFDEGDYIEGYAFQNMGLALSTEPVEGAPYMALTWLGQ